MIQDPTDPLEAARRANRALAERVAELERQLMRFEDGSSAPAALGTALSERLALLSEAERIAHMGSWVWDIGSDEVLWSEGLYRILGYDPANEPASSGRFYERVHPEDRARVHAAADLGVHSGVGERVNYRIVQPDGGVRHLTMNAALLFDGAGNPQRAVGVIVDVTEARESALEVKRTAELLANAQRIGKMGSFEMRPLEGRLLWSEQLYRVLDIDPSVPPSIEAFLSRVHEDERERVARLVERSHALGLSTRSRARIVHRNGSVHHVDMVADISVDASGHVVSVAGTLTDVTELVRLEALFHQSQKMEAIGQLAGGLAHDYNNLLMVISGNAELMLPEHECPELREILVAAGAATTVTNRLLAFSRHSAQRARATRLADDLEESKGILRRALGDGIVMQLRLDPEGWPVFVDRGQIQQILLNLALNARDAMPEGGSFYLATRNVRLSAAEARLRNERPGDYLVLSVTDTGIGMDEPTRQRVFEPFFTTKPQGRGTGLGLAMVFGSVKQCGGFVEVTSQPRVGTTFYLWFPRAAEAPQVTSTSERAARAGRGSVLLVEDNPAVADIARRILESGGYSARVTHDPHDAARMWQAEPADVLVTDVEMPGMSGVRLSQQLQRISPELRTLFITGHSREQLEQYCENGRSAVVMKPFRRNELLGQLARLLEDHERP